MISRRAGIYLLSALTIAVVMAGLLVPRTAQPLSYHQFADERRWLGLPNFPDVASNIVFAAAGLAGLWYLSGRSGGAQFIDPREKCFYVFFFLGLLLTAFGSSYYHLAPDNARLVWDRLPMTVVFMSLVAAVIAERISVPAGLGLLPVLLGMGIASVLEWYASEFDGRAIYASMPECKSTPYSFCSWRCCCRRATREAPTLRLLPVCIWSLRFVRRPTGKSIPSVTS